MNAINEVEVEYSPGCGFNNGGSNVYLKNTNLSQKIITICRLELRRMAHETRHENRQYIIAPGQRLLLGCSSGNTAETANYNYHWEVIEARYA